MSSQKLFLGVTVGRRNNWEQFFNEPAATRATKPESVAKEIEEKREKRNQIAHFWPVAGTVSTCVILDQEGKEVFSAAGGFSVKEGEVSHQAFMLLHQLIGEEPLTSIPLFGFSIRDRIRLMALDALRYINTQPNVETIPSRLWLHRAFENGPWADPCDLLIPSDLRNDISWSGLCDFLNITVPDRANLDTDATLQAELSRQIAIKAGILDF